MANDGVLQYRSPDLILVCELEQFTSIEVAEVRPMKDVGPSKMEKLTHMVKEVL